MVSPCQTAASTSASACRIGGPIALSLVGEPPRTISGKRDLPVTPMHAGGGRGIGLFFSMRQIRAGRDADAPSGVDNVMFRNRKEGLDPRGRPDAVETRGESRDRWEVDLHFAAGRMASCGC